MTITMLTSNNLDHDDFIDMGTPCCFLPCENLSNLPDFLRFVGFVGRAAVLYSVTLEHVSPSIISTMRRNLFYTHAHNIEFLEKTFQSPLT